MGESREGPDGSWVLAIDFGTSNTSAAWKDSSGQVRELRLGSTGALMPSAVMAVQGGLVVGETAARSALVDPAAFEPAPKRRIADGEVLLDGQSFTATDPISAVLVDVIARAERVAGSPPSQVILTHPDRWGMDLQELLRQAGSRAGIDAEKITLLSEARAAAWYYTDRSVKWSVGQRLAVFDFGAGTCDVAVLEKLRDGTFSVVVAEGVDGLGGRDLDARLWGWVRRELALSHPQLLPELDSRDGLRRRLTLMDRVREAKEVLSGMSMASIVVPGREVDAVLTLTRAEFEELIRADVEQAVMLVRQVLALAGDPRPDRIYLTGGSSLIPLVHAELSEISPVGELGDPQTVVSHGALLAPQSAPIEPPAPGRGQGRVSRSPIPPLQDPDARPRRTGKPVALSVGAMVLVGALATLISLGVSGGGGSGSQPASTTTQAPRTTTPAPKTTTQDAITTTQPTSSAWEMPSGDSSKFDFGGPPREAPATGPPVYIPD